MTDGGPAKAGKSEYDDSLGEGQTAKMQAYNVLPFLLLLLSSSSLSVSTPRP